MKLSLLVLFGGESNEHEVSLRSAAAVIKNADKEKYDIIKSLILDIREDEQVKIFKKEDMIKAVFTSKNADEMESLFISYGELFGAIDGLVS
jgi:D-alanine-D-alanine ligase-like ATP-grasp enzyme